MYEAEDAELYDLVHQGRGKDYAAESARVVALARQAAPAAHSLLDIACGTGHHLRYFADEFAEVAGVDLSEDMLATAKALLPGVPLHQADMRDFTLNRKFDVVTCMFSSIGHMRSVAELQAAIDCFGRHTTSGGVAVVDPWWFPETFLPGYVAADVVRTDHRTVARVSHSSVAGNATRMEVHYLVADPEHGVRHVHESTLITLFSQREYEQAFERAGFTPSYADSAPGQRGLFVARRR
ncbi:class I SAM-dependent methyltransferase [Natronosporangium hydrolyticum]|uniref:Class I SAM-dependent methyltransferase n=1 Tax=Natronosporangium hydrolyticum TaxID=2811111 RepID=A0A895YPY3_9ACTN|nr:class I SAM-dependent methyltransferase [Natronosporangium hydrolyticum]QSB16038.1 class I SAM-dependent methyltransferase [Natronosporangium hydrolyticum]